MIKLFLDLKPAITYTSGISTNKEFKNNTLTETEWATCNDQGLCDKGYRSLRPSAWGFNVLGKAMDSRVYVCTGVQ